MHQPEPLDDLDDESLAAAARAAAGIERLRPGQAEAIRAGVRGDTVAVLASGTGKTAVYESVAHLLGGTAVVVSPTISLQRDQEQTLREHGRRAVALNSARGARARRQALEGWADGALDVLLLSAEQLVSDEVRDHLARRPPTLLVVDEAHCVSEWGHDFRPDYLRLGEAVAVLGRPRVLALTATASRAVREDVVRVLGLEDPAVVLGDFDRPTIWLGARVFVDERSRDAAVLEAARDVDGAVVVYAPTRRRCTELADALTDAGRPAEVYHAGLPAAQRRSTQDAFLDGRLQTVVATSAFGMGIDRADVRAVLHAGPATSVEEYFQEAGRAGRDGEPATAVLFYRLEDFALGRYFASGTALRDGDVAGVVRVLAAADGVTAPADLAERSGLTRRRLSLVLGALGARDALVRSRNGVRLRASAARDPKALLDAVAEHAERRGDYDRTRADLMRTYAETQDCRRRVVLELLGQEARRPCGLCDACDAGTSRSADRRPWPLGSQVSHDRWGVGTVSHYEADRVVVLFADGGYRTLDLDVVADHHLLEATA